MPTSNCHVEVELKPDSELDYSFAAAKVRAALQSLSRALEEEGALEVPMPSVHRFGDDTDLCRHLSQRLDDPGFERQIELFRFTDAGEWSFLSADTHCTVHAYQLFDGSVSDLKHLTEDEEEDEISAEKSATVLDLPSTATDGLWDTLVYDDAIKNGLLSYINTTLRFSQHDVDAHIVAWNRIVLLHGPPGTGKTSLAKALAHKLSIRLNSVYVSGRLVEINAHSLFSKWFSESGKLVQALFEMINKLCDDEAVFVTLLIDEVESLTGARQAAMNGNEPSDAIRVVNALLTQIDKLKQRRNVLIIATSNITGAIDDAFVDRADIQQYIGNPSTKAIEVILGGCLAELCKKGLVLDDHTSLNTIAVLCKKKDVSGRFLRKLPLLAFAHTQLDQPAKKDMIEAMKTCIENK